MAEFQWWLLLVGLVFGGGLVAVVFLDGTRREQDIEESELPAEARFVAMRLESRGITVDPDDVEAVLREHREYRLFPPPDRLEPIEPPVDAATLSAARSAARAAARPVPPDGLPAAPERAPRRPPVAASVEDPGARAD
jgi:hypothetical protein